MRPALGLAVALALAACDDPLVPPEEIADLRVLAARAEVTGDSDRASPRPGEEVTVRVLAAGPSGTASVTWGLLACDAEATTTGLPRCRDAIARSEARTASPAAPSLTFGVPDDVGRLAIIGVVCDGGEPRLSLDAADVGCDGDVRRAAPFTFRVTPAIAEEDDNENPAVAADAFRLDGAAWTNDVDAPCDAAEPSPTVAPRSDATIAFDVGGAAEMTDEGVETLEIAHYVTTGDLERHFTVVEPGGDPRQSIAWKAPAEAGTAMHFYAVVRDGRGGVTWARRSACVEAR